MCRLDAGLATRSLGDKCDTDESCVSPVAKMMDSMPRTELIFHSFLFFSFLFVLIDRADKKRIEKAVRES
jgi:hypothetical protein